MPRSPETRPGPERPEAGFESAEAAAPEAAPATERPEAAPVGETSVAAAYSVAAPPSQVSKDPTLLEVEEIMEDDLKDTYLALSPAARAKFKKRGEIAAERIRKMLASAKTNAHKVLRLIVDWLRTIPHVNRFFLEQEAKLKTDRIMRLAEREREGRS